MYVGSSSGPEKSFPVSIPSRVVEEKRTATLSPTPLPRTSPPKPVPTPSPTEGVWREPQRCNSDSMCAPNIFAISAVSGGVGTLLDVLTGGGFRLNVTLPSYKVPFWGETYNSNTFNSTMRHMGLSSYCALFKKGLGTYGLDYSDQYLTTSGTPEDIYYHIPSAKIIIILSDPAIRVLSHRAVFPFTLMSQKKRSLLPTDDILKDISRYKSCMLSKPKGPILDYRSLCRQKSFLFSSFYSESIRRWWRVFDQKNVLVLYENDLKRESNRTLLEGMKQFIGVGDTDVYFNGSYRKDTVVDKIVAENGELLNELYHLFSEETNVLETMLGSTPPWKHLIADESDYKNRSIFSSWLDATNQIKESTTTVTTSLPQYEIKTPILEPTRETSQCDYNELRNNSFPSVFLLGSQKCATSTLSSILKLHPQLFTTIHKEVQWFATGYGPSDAPWHQHHLEKRSLGTNWYQDQFKATKTDSLKLGIDCSANYMSSFGAADEVSELLPKGVKLIISLCDPVQRAYSMFRMWSSQAVYARGYPIGNRYDFLIKKNKSDPFYAAVQAEAADYVYCIENGPYNMFGSEYSTTEYCESRSVLLHRGLYVRHLQRWIKRFGSSNTLVLFKSEIASSPLSVLRKVEKFLCLDEVPESSIDSVKLHSHHNVDPFDCNQLKSKIKGTVECSGNHWDDLSKTVRQGISPEAMDFLESFYKCEEGDLRNLLQMDELPGWRDQKK